MYGAQLNNHSKHFFFRISVRPYRLGLRSNRIVVDLVPEEVHWSRHGSASKNQSRYKELMIVHQDSVCQDSTLMHVLHTIHKTNNIEITVVHQIDIGKSNREWNSYFRLRLNILRSYLERIQPHLELGVHGLKDERQPELCHQSAWKARSLATGAFNRARDCVANSRWRIWSTSCSRSRGWNLLISPHILSTTLDYIIGIQAR